MTFPTRCTEVNSEETSEDVKSERRGTILVGITRTSDVVDPP